MKNQDSNIKKNYSVPTGYFDDLEKNVLSRTVNRQSAKTRRLSFVKPWMSLAAAFLILASVGAYWIWNDSPQSTFQADQTQIDYLEDMDDELFAALMLNETDEENVLEDLADFLIELEDEME